MTARYEVKTWSAPLGDTGDYEAGASVVDKTTGKIVCDWYGEEALDSRAKMVCDALNQREEIRAPREKSSVMMRAALIAKSERIRLRNEARIAKAERRDVTAGLLLAKAETADAIYRAICEAPADQSNEASIARDAERLSETIAYAVRNDQGYWCGIWSDRDLAESIVAKGQPSHHEKVVTLRVVEE